MLGRDLGVGVAVWHLTSHSIVSILWSLLISDRGGFIGLAPFANSEERLIGTSKKSRTLAGADTLRPSVLYVNLDSHVSAARIMFAGLSDSLFVNARRYCRKGSFVVWADVGFVVWLGIPSRLGGRVHLRRCRQWTC